MAPHKGNRHAAKYDDGKMDEICKDLLKFAYESPSIVLAKWCYEHGFSKGWLCETAKHYPQLQEALNQAKELQAAKIVDKSFDGSGNATFGMFILPMYDDDFKELLKWKASLSKDDGREGSKAALVEYLERLKSSK